MGDKTKLTNDKTEGLHEVVHTISVLLDTFNNHVIEHRVLKDYPELEHTLEKASRMMYDAYGEASAAMFEEIEALNKDKPNLSRDYFSEWNVTDWYPDDVKPVRSGVYQRCYFGRKNLYSRWDVAAGEWYISYSTPEAAAVETTISHQRLEWRGLRYNPER